MDPELFNFFNTGVSQSVASGSGVDTVPTAPDLSGAIDPAATNGSGINFPTLGQGLQVGGDFLSAYGYYTAGQESQDAYNYNAQLALLQGEFAQEQLVTSEEDTLSTQRAMYAKSGVTMSGSPLDTAVQTASQFEMDKQILNFNTQSQANMDRYKGEVAKQQADFKGTMAILSGVEDLAFALI